MITDSGRYVAFGNESVTFHARGMRAARDRTARKDNKRYTMGDISEKCR